ncbi:MAG: MnhB domain-containing protein [Lachnospiraceae bacterium]|nr:MnhB domain-containing protein [Lachnospiraceae bacterium]MDD3796074.1 MnhB domain-containing protein [Lachnospiraceae bacterium]
MSRKRSEKEYQKTAEFHFRRWLEGSKDPFLDTVELKPQKKFAEEDAVTKKRQQELNELRLALYDKNKNRVVKGFEVLYKICSPLFCILIIGALLIAVSFLPPEGNASNPVNNEVEARYLEAGLQETGAVNSVAGMILNYRAFDTFGETNVLYIATCCVMILLLVEDDKIRNKLQLNDREFEPRNDVILQKVAMLLVPIVFMFGIYVMLNGHLGPGGGFAGGAMVGAGLILYVSAYGTKKTQRFFNEKIYTVIKVTALCLYGLLMVYFYYTGANGLDNHIPLGIPGNILSSGLILPINVLVGTEVACTMYAFYALFRRGDV